MKHLVSLLCLFCCFTSNAQHSANFQVTDRIILGIPSSQTSSTADIAAYIKTHFPTDEEKIRAAYTWVTTNIKYDTDSIHRVILEEDRDQKITFALRRKKGICENFAAIFNDICLKSGINSYVIEGYTKQGGSVDRTAHVWCAAYIKDQWFLYDPTWDAGFINNGNFTAAINTNYFQVSPERFIQTHMPYDPMFQFLNYPLTYKEFSAGNTRVNNSKPYFNFKDSISAYEQQNPLTRYLAAFNRIEDNNQTTTGKDIKLKQLKLETELIYQDQDMQLYNQAVADYNAAIIIYNKFLNYRNNQFKPAKSNDEVALMFSNVARLISSANIKITEIGKSKATLVLDTGDIQKKVNDLKSHLKEQESFFKNYLSEAKK